MFDLWKDELTSEETDALLDKVAGEIRGRGLEAPAILFFLLPSEATHCRRHSPKRSKSKKWLTG